MSYLIVLLRQNNSQELASKIVNYLLSNNLEEKFPEIFELATELELPAGVNKYSQETAEDAWQKLRALVAENFKDQSPEQD